MGSCAGLYRLLSVLLLAFSLVAVASQQKAGAATGAAEGLVALNKLHESGKLSLNNAAQTPLRQWVNAPDADIRMNARLLLASLYTDDGNDRLAARLYREIIADPLAGDLPQREVAILKLAQIHRRAGEGEEALKLLEPIVKEKAGSAVYQIEAAYWCAVIHRERGDEAHMREAATWAIHTAQQAISSPQELPFWKDLTSMRGLKLTAATEGDLLSKANAERLSGNYLKAEKLYGEALVIAKEEKIKAGARWGRADCLLGLGKASEALGEWHALYQEDPVGPYRGQTLISLGDWALEYDFNLARARESYARAHEVLERMRSELGADMDATWEAISENAYQRMGLATYIGAEAEAALGWFKSARKYAKPPQPLLTGLEPAPRPIDTLIDLCESGRQLTPALVLRGNERVGLMLFIADFKLMGGDPLRAKHLHDRILDEQERVRLKPISVQAEYASYRRTEALYALKRHQDHYEAVCQAIARYPKSAWVPDLLLRKGVAEYTRKRDPEAACVTFDALVEKHRGHPLAESAMWYSATVKYWQGDWKKAAVAYRQFIQAFPKSEFRKIIESELLPDIREHMQGKPEEIP